MTAMQRGEAETVAVEVLGWMAGQEEVIARFIAASGATPDDLRRAAGDAEFLGFVLDHLMGDEVALLACCEDLGLAPEAPGRARAGLPGGDLPHWT